MRLLLDENMSQAFRFHLPGHDVQTVGFLHLTGLSNGDLLRKMVELKIQVLVTLDKNLQYQQNVAKAGIAVIVLRPKTNKLHDVIPPPHRCKKRSKKCSRAR
jgi:hypothetical protein